VGGTYLGDPIEVPVTIIDGDEPGTPVCHLLRLTDETRAEVGRRIGRGEFDGSRSCGQRWMADDRAAE
jgi:hypothetical protein